MLEWRVLRSRQWAHLSPKAIKLLLDMGGQFNGSNNGNLACAWSVMKQRGWRSKGSLDDAMLELLQLGWLRVTRPGDRRRPNLFAMTMFPIDECGGIHGARSTRTAPDDWKDGRDNRGDLNRYQTKKKILPAKGGKTTRRAGQRSIAEP